jgi:hypothetical protein
MIMMDAKVRGARQSIDNVNYTAKHNSAFSMPLKATRFSWGISSTIQSAPNSPILPTIIAW